MSQPTCIYQPCEMTIGYPIGKGFICWLHAAQSGLAIHAESVGLVPTSRITMSTTERSAEAGGDTARNLEPQGVVPGSAKH